jgi:hypothetical protein
MAPKQTEKAALVTLDTVVGFPYEWSTPGMAQAGQSILETLQEGDWPIAQREAQKEQLKALVLVDLLTGAIPRIEIRTLETGRFRVRKFDEMTMPPLAVEMLSVLNRLPQPIQIDEWAILEEPPSPRPAPRDPHLAFLIGKRWFSVYRW